MTGEVEEVADETVRSGLSSMGFVALLVAHFALTGQWGWLWWTAFVLAIAGAVAGWSHGPDDRPRAGRGPSN